MSFSKPGVAVIYRKSFLTGLMAGKTITEWIICNSRASASKLAREMREAKVASTELTEDLYKVTKVKVVPFNKAMSFNALAAYKG